MSNSLTKPKNLEDAVREKVRNVLFEALPDEHVDQWIKAEFQRFFEDPVKPSHADRNWEGISPFKRMVRGELDKRIKGRMIEWFDNNFESVWTDGKQTVAMNETVKCFAQTVLSGFGEMLAADALSRIQNELHGRSNY